ncbi:serine/threonine-protein kinase Kist [Gymnodraco acuticeps]|uniref:Serine/threonine-protein kinase Kist n=1 Tax=Gymnodraco acuticeps TaxID=8218 RepID=A0A6P8U4Z0_GYMAC|nr:serine/threonine-protein kinase Kist [Gymnodraco acuticeps]
MGVATRCLLLELLDVSVSDLLTSGTQGGRPQQGHSMWLVQHCARDILEALAFLHREGYVHADLKPRNILWSADDECFKLIDFGLSFKEGNQDVKYIQTDGYRAPEAELQNSLAQAGVEVEGDSGCTSAVDMWGLGIILLEMFSGMKLKETVRSQKWKENSASIVDHLFASNSVVCPAIPVYHLRDLIKSMLLNNPKQRCSAETALLSPLFSIPFAPHIEDLVLLPTPVLRLLNLIDDSHLHNEEEYEEILEDMKEECQKYGSVVSLLIPKENPGKGQVFVEYANSSDSKEAQRLLTGRTFDGKLVVATFYPLSAYKRDMKSYSDGLTSSRSMSPSSRSSPPAAQINGVLQWLSESPDLYPIERPWCCLKAAIHKSHATNVKNLEQICQEVRNPPNSVPSW